jgi:hypothetical protein
MSKDSAGRDQVLSNCSTWWYKQSAGARCHQRKHQQEDTMSNFSFIPVTDPRCRELQNGYSNYSDGLILADSKFTDLDGEHLVGPVHTVPEGTGRLSRELYANVHVSLGRIDGKTVYGIRFWTERCSDRGYFHSNGFNMNLAYIQEHYTDVTENGGIITCKDNRGSERVFEATSRDGWFTENRNR